MITLSATGNALLDLIFIKLLTSDIYKDAQQLVKSDQDIVADQADIQYDNAQLAAQQALLAADTALSNASIALLDQLNVQSQTMNDKLTADQNTIHSLQKAIKAAKGSDLTQLQTQLTQAKATYAADQASAQTISDNLKQQQKIQTDLMHQLQSDQKQINKIQHDITTDQKDLSKDLQKFNNTILDFKGDADQLAKLVAQYRADGGTETSIQICQDGKTVTLDLSMLGSDNYNALLKSFTGQVLSALDQLKANNDTVSTDGFTSHTLIDVLAQDMLTSGAVISQYSTTSANGVNINLVDGKLDYTPGAQFLHLALGQTLQDSFSYTISDGVNSSTATVSITINGLYVPPTAQNLIQSLDKSASLSHINFSGAENAPGASLTYQVVMDGEVLSQLSNNTYQLAGGGILTNNGDGTFSYTPDNTFQYLGRGAVDTVMFHYKATDGYATSSQATVTINVQGHADAPTLNALDASQITGSTVNNVLYTSHNILTFSGTGDIGETILLYSPQGVLGQAVVDQSGHWSSVSASPLADGNYIVFAHDASNGLDSTYVIRVAVDTQAPSAPTVSQVVPGGDGDGLTWDFSGTLDTREAGDLITVYDNNQALTTALVDSAGHWTATINYAYLGDNLSFKATDLAGNVSAAGFIPVTANNFTAPDTILSNQSLTHQALQGFDLNPEINNHLSYQILVDGTYISAQPVNGVYTLQNGATVSLNSDGTFDFDPHFHYGTMQFQYMASDPYGHQSNPATVSVLVSQVPFTVNNLPQSLPNQDLNYTNHDSFSISGTGQPGDVMHLSLSPTDSQGWTAAQLNALSVGTNATIDALGNWSINTNSYIAHLQDGQYVAKFTDSLNTAAAKTLTVTVDTHAPDAPVPSASSIGPDQSYVFSGALGAAEAGDLIQAYKGTVLVGSAQVVNDGSWSVNITNANIASNLGSLSFTATDLAGNVSAPGAVAMPIIANNQDLGQLNLLSGYQYAVYNNSFNVQDSNPLPHLDQYNIIVDGVHVLSQVGNTYNLADGIKLINTQDGHFTIDTHYYSHAGAGGVSSYSFQYQVTDGDRTSNIGSVLFNVLDNAPGILTIDNLADQYTGPQHIANYTNDMSFVITGHGIAGATYYSTPYMLGGNLSFDSSPPITADANGAWSTVISFANPGFPQTDTFSLYVHTADETLLKAYKIINYSNVTPNAPVLTVDNGSHFHGIAAPNGAVTIYDAGTHAQLGQVFTDSAGNWDANISNVSSARGASFSTTDVYGNISSETPEPTVSVQFNPNNPSVFDLTAANDNVDSLLIRYQLDSKTIDNNSGNILFERITNATVSLAPGQTAHSTDVGTFLEQATINKTAMVTLSILADPAYHIDHALASVIDKVDSSGNSRITGI